jgi:hypothetical protein
VIVATTVVGGGVWAAEPRATDIKQAQAIELIVDKLGQLNSRLSKMESEQKRQLIRNEITKNPQLIRLASELASTVGQTREPDQQERFFRMMAEISCQVLQDGCELRAQMEKLEYRIRELEREHDNPHAPIVDPLYAEPSSPSSPSIPWSAPTAPPSLPSTPWQPLAQGQKPRRQWNNIPDYILDNPTKLDPRAVLFKQCVDIPSDTPLHGNVYVDSNGKYVLVKHNKTRTAVPHFVARRPL